MSNEPARRDAGVRSVERAIGVLDALGAGGWKTGAEVARELGVHRSTALRLLGTLERHGLVERDPRTAKYRLGRRLPQLASAVTGELDLRAAARPVCERLAAALGETVTLDVPAGDGIEAVEQASGSAAVVRVNWLGRRYPAHCTASGKAVLAFGPEPLRRRLLGSQLERWTERTVTDPGLLEAELAVVRYAGVARTHEELEVGLDAVAAPVFDAGGVVVAALDVSGPSFRLRTDETRVAELTRQAAADLSRRLGHRMR